MRGVFLYKIYYLGPAKVFIVHSRGVFLQQYIEKWDREKVSTAVLYKAAVSLCVRVCTPSPFFRHDRLIATKFGTHV